MMLLSVAILLSFFPTANKVYAKNEPVNLAKNPSGVGFPSIVASGTCPCEDSAWRTINGIFNFDGGSHDRWTNYAVPHSSDSLTLDFGSVKSFNQVKLYLFNDGGGVKTPASYQVFYSTGTEVIEGVEVEHWAAVHNEIKTPLFPQAQIDNPKDHEATVANSLNTVNFDTVNSQKLKIVLNNGDAWVGVVELEVYNIVPTVPLVSFYSAFSNISGNSVTLDVYNDLDGTYEMDPAKFKVYNGETLYSTISNVFQNALDHTITLTLNTPLADDTNTHYQIRLLNGAFRTILGELSASVNNIPIIQMGQLDFNDDSRIGIDDIVYLLASNSPLKDINNSGTVDDTDIQILLKQITP